MVGIQPIFAVSFMTVFTLKQGGRKPMTMSTALSAVGRWQRIWIARPMPIVFVRVVFPTPEGEDKTNILPFFFITIIILVGLMFKKSFTLISPQ